MACSWKREKDKIRYDDGGNEVKTKGVATHIIVGIKGIRFCELGDSGSFIISCDGKICGVLHSMLDDNGSELSDLPLATAAKKTSMYSIIACLGQDPDRHGVSKLLMAVDHDNLICTV